MAHTHSTEWTGWRTKNFLATDEKHSCNNRQCRMVSNRRQRKHPSNRTIWTSKGHKHKRRAGWCWCEGKVLCIDKYFPFENFEWSDARSTPTFLHSYILCSERDKEREGVCRIEPIWRDNLSCAFSAFRFIVSTKLLPIDNRDLSPLSLDHYAVLSPCMCAPLWSHPLPNRIHWQKEDTKWETTNKKRIDGFELPLLLHWARCFQV